MSVINCNVKYILHQYQYLKEQIKDNNNVYISRDGVIFIKNNKTKQKAQFTKNQSIFANQFKIGKDKTCKEVINKIKNILINIFKFIILLYILF